MSSPQLENGYARIANEVLMALAQLDLSPYEARVMWVIFSKTYGNYGRKMDKISLSQFSDWTGIERRNVRRSLASLLARNVIAASPNGNGVSYGLQKDHDRWKPRGVSPKTLSGKTLSPKTLKVVSPETPKIVSAATPTKEKDRDLPDSFLWKEPISIWPRQQTCVPVRPVQWKNRHDFIHVSRVPNGKGPIYCWRILQSQR